MVAIIRSCVCWVPAQGVSFMSTGERIIITCYFNIYLHEKCLPKKNYMRSNGSIQNASLVKEWQVDELIVMPTLGPTVIVTFSNNIILLVKVGQIIISLQTPPTPYILDEIYVSDIIVDQPLPPQIIGPTRITYTLYQI